MVVRKFNRMALNRKNKNASVAGRTVGCKSQECGKIYFLNFGSAPFTSRFKAFPGNCNARPLIDIF